MNGLFLLYCILGPLLCGANLDTDTTSPLTSHNTRLSASVSQVKSSPSPGPQPASTSTATTSNPPITTTTTTTSTPTTPTTLTTLFDMFYKKECHPVLLVSGGLIIVCIILLVSTLLLACKVYQLKSHIEVLSSNADLISKSEYWMGTAKKDKCKSETEVKETSMLMVDVSQTQEEVVNGTTKEEGGTVQEDGQVGEENKKKEEGDTVIGEEVSTTPETVAETSSTPKPQEEPTNSKSSEGVAASSSEGTGEPKDVV